MTTKIDDTKKQPAQRPGMEEALHSTGLTTRKTSRRTPMYGGPQMTPGNRRVAMQPKQTR